MKFSFLRDSFCDFCDICVTFNYPLFEGIPYLNEARTGRVHARTS